MGTSSSSPGLKYSSSILLFLSSFNPATLRKVCFKSRGLASPFFTAYCRMSLCGYYALCLALFATAVVVESDTVRQVRFYVHDRVGGDNPTVWKVAESNLSNVLPSLFGLVLVTDTPITAAAEGDSEYLGQIQGLIAYSDMRKAAITVLVNVVFTAGEYNGSTLSLVGRNPINDDSREVSVVAGTGAFRYARGHVITRTYSASADQTQAVYQYDATVLLPELAVAVPL